jgi:cellulose synthase/poly-beta-1,6-N-acetylglucosamine synthase-like glycosyltransferase
MIEANRLFAPMLVPVAILGLVAAIVAAYAAWLARAPRRRPRPASPPPDWPPVDVVVAVFNERHLLPGKLRNLAALEYPRDRVRFLIVDGGSTDGSAELIAEWCRGRDGYVALVAALPDKTAQLNLALTHARAPWIVVTDADARLPSRTLWQLMSAAHDNPTLGAIGCPVAPRRAHPAERLYWRLLNALQWREWRHGSASMVMGPCYAFRRCLLNGMPDDVICDDAHVAWHVGSCGYRIGMAAPIVRELRGPATMRQMFGHKLRKGVGVLREALRFLPHAGRMSGSLRTAFVFRVALFLLGPVLAVSSAVTILVAAVWLVTSVELFAVAAIGLLLCARWNLARRAWMFAMVGVVLVAAASMALLTYPFNQQTSCHSRLPSG